MGWFCLEKILPKVSNHFIVMDGERKIRIIVGLSLTDGDVKIAAFNEGWRPT